MILCHQIILALAGSTSGAKPLSGAWVFQKNTQLHAIAPVVGRIGQRLNALGITTSADLDAFWKLVKMRGGVHRGQTIAGRTGRAKCFTVLLEGVACLSTQHEDGTRHIHAFHHTGDFPGLDSLVFPQSAEPSEVQALTSCSIGIIDRDALEQAMQRHPALGRALWRAAMMEAIIIRQRLFTARRPALERVAHLLCEQLTRLGINQGGIPLNQIDVADAVGLSVVHANRIFQELRQLGMLSKQRTLEVVDKKRLEELAAFDGRYLNPSESLSRWDLRIDD
jgi:CRP-like cAMP-binding protein